MEELLGLKHKRAVVAGGGQGMGESSALILARAGCHTGVIDLDSNAAERVAARVAAMGVQSATAQGDVTSENSAPELLREIAEGLGGPLDILVTVVGGVRTRKPLVEMSLEYWLSDQRLNLQSFFLLAQAFAKASIIAGRPGVITCIGSVAGLGGSAGIASYGAAKAGLTQLVQSMAAEWASHGIRVNAVAPGTIITPRLPDTQANRERAINSLLPMKRRGTTEEIAKAVLFLSSDLSSYTTGHTLLVDGGWMSAYLLAPAPDHKLV